MSDEANALALLEQYKRTYGVGTPTGADTPEMAKNALVRAYEAIGRPAGRVVGGVMDVLGIPARTVAAIGTNLAGTRPPVDVSDYALYGRDLETGRQATHYGDALAGTLEESGELAPGGLASKIVAAAGNLITDPTAAPLLLGAGEAAGALAGRYSRVAGPVASPPPQVPLGRLDPSFAEMPAARPAARPARPRVPQSVGAAAAQPLPVEDLTATQPVRGYARVGGELPDTATQPVRTIKPKARTSGGSIEGRFNQERANVKAKHRAPKPQPKASSIEEQYGRMTGQDRPAPEGFERINRKIHKTVKNRRKPKKEA